MKYDLAVGTIHGMFVIDKQIGSHTRVTKKKFAVHCIECGKERIKSYASVLNKGNCSCKNKRERARIKAAGGEFVRFAEVWNKKHKVKFNTEKLTFFGKKYRMKGKRAVFVDTGEDCISYYFERIEQENQPVWQVNMWGKYE